MAAAIDPALAANMAADTNGEQLPPVSQAVQQAPPTMQTLQPQHPDQYRALPAPPHMYAPPYPQPPMGAYPPPQPAPRQRTAIACRYCRRRKIRCSGFDQSEDGRCTNCQRFSQECVFTPVSAQTQAFVPAHTVWRGQNPPPNTQLYGAYGQPLPQHGQRDPYAQPQQGGQYPPPPQGYQQPPMYQPQQGQPPNMQPLQGQQSGAKRSNDEPHTPTLPPPNPAEQGQRGSFGYPDPTGLNPAGASPASSTISFHSAQPQPYYPQQPARISPQSSYSYDPSRASSSPHTLGLSAAPAPPGSVPYQSGRTPPQGNAAAAHAARQGVQINELVGPGGQQQQQQQYQAMQQAIQQAMKQEGRTSTDSSMVQALRHDPNKALIDGVTTGAEKDEARRRNGEVKDVGVQTDDLHLPVKEQAS
ncbi:hypothetical protein LTR78_007021 [Recurvomyces mirabilis]|uniref:Zn(2)-C6 fungal-type domain-containing protein n=1 Tax=Recurvomyces mirabilis TaxID=574656 RepID=A0AAE0WK40_9PEZI|nr:hypothetical protein LTR78_007021 [Recurvomyces mirabilis]KAK5153405.1 hypothetical protein LTS14_007574 [Recurvomyces mirabilis]